MPGRHAHSLPSEVVDTLAMRLPDEQRALYFTMLSKRLKDTDTYTTLAWTLGGLGIHRLYLGQITHAAVQVIMGPMGLFLVIGGIAGDTPAIALVGVVLILADLIAWASDLIRYASIIEEQNRLIKLKILEQIKPTILNDYKEREM